MKTKKAISLILALFIVWAALPIQSAFASGTRWYVMQVASGSGNGTSWEHASSNLKGIMDGAGNNDEIWVAAGTYKPGGNVTDTFLLKAGVKVYGGFLGTETELSDRNWVTNKTILDGDSKNRHVVTGGTYATPDDTRLDGFTITGGNANGDIFNDNQGGGMFNNISSPTVANCTFSGNTAKGSGGGMCNTAYSSPTVTNCTFSGNTANSSGGGMCNYNNSSPTVTDCTFSGNTVMIIRGNNGGGGMCNQTKSSPKVKNCTFSNNTTNNCDGGMNNSDNSSPTVENCAFSGNSANRYGGGMYNYNNSSPTVTNCTLSDNTATLSGGGMGNYKNSSPILANTILWGNTAPADWGPDIFQDLGTLNLKNCVVGEYKRVNAGENISNLITGDPKLKALNKAGGNPDTAADVYIYKLQTGSSAIDAGLPVGDDIGNGVKVPDKDQRGTGRPKGAGVDIGSYEAEYTITSVEVTPDTASVKKGKTKNFTANVTGTGDYNNTVTWSVEDKTSSGTTISDSGTLAVAADENATALTVKATSKGDSTKSDTATVTVEETVAVTGVTVDPETLTLTAGGAAETLTATVLPTDAANKDVTWASNNETVATVANGVVTPLAAGQAIITVKTVDGNYQATCTVYVNATTVAVTSVTVAPETLTLTAGGATGTLTATVLPDDATNKDVTWASNNEAVATVANGVVTPVAAGQAIITVKTVDGNYQATCTVNVNAATVAVTGVTVAPETLTLTAGGATGTLTATVLPAEATNKDVTWASNNEAVATVANGVVTPVAAGQAIITVKTVDGNYQAACTVNVNAATVAVTSISVDPETLTLTAGGATGTLTATVLPDDATNKDVTWASNNEAVATVANGIVTPVAAGQAIITVKTVDGSKTAACTVTVQAAAVPVTGVKLNKTSTTLVVGGSETLFATVEPATATNKNVKWSSDKLSVATVDTIGNIKAVGVGTATITVTTEDGSKTATCTVTVQLAGINYTTFSGDGQTHTRSSGEDLLLTVKRNTEDNKSFGLFRELRKDGAPVSKSHYTTQGGSIIIRLKSAWLDTLSAGLHTLSIIFEDGEAKASFTIKAKPGSFEDVTVPKDSFTFTKLWQGGTEKSIDWTLYDEMDQVAHKLFNKKVASKTEWKYEAWFDKPVSRYVVEKPVSGYSTRYKNVGVYAGITDRCCNGGTIINYKIPQTGDKADLALWAGLVLLGITGIGIALMAGKRRKTRK